jgi:ADP-ribosylglycohydrolase
MIGVGRRSIAHFKGCFLAALSATPWAPRWSSSASNTHGHPSGYYSAGCFAAIIQQLLAGRSLPEAIDRGAGHSQPGQTPRSRRVLGGDSAGACPLARSEACAITRDEMLGGGWVGEEALAIALYSALVAEDDFARAVRLAVNHSGDSDSTAAIAGNLVGLMVGVEGIPSAWLDGLELREEIEAVAADLYSGFQESDGWFQRYPGW